MVGAGHRQQSHQCSGPEKEKRWHIGDLQMLPGARQVMETRERPGGSMSDTLVYSSCPFRKVLSPTSLDLYPLMLSFIFPSSFET